MFDRLIELVRLAQRHSNFRLRISYSPISDWSVEIFEADRTIIYEQGVDPYRIASVGYLFLSGYLSQEYGGY